MKEKTAEMGRDKEKEREKERDNERENGRDNEINEKWLPLECSPEVCAAFVTRLKYPVELLKFSEIYSVDDEFLDMIDQPTIALLFVLPLTEQIEASRDRMTVVDPESLKSGNVWFTRQVIANSCGSIALLHLLNNLPAPFSYDALGLSHGVDGGGLDDAAEAEEDTGAKGAKGGKEKGDKGLGKKWAKGGVEDPETRGKRIAFSPAFIAAHKSLENLGTSAPAPNTREHFVLYLYKPNAEAPPQSQSNSPAGKVPQASLPQGPGEILEFDGRLEGVVSHGQVASPKDLLRFARKIIQETTLIEPNLRCSMIAVSLVANV